MEPLFPTNGYICFDLQARQQLNSFQIWQRLPVYDKKVLQTSSKRSLTNTWGHLPSAICLEVIYLLVHGVHDR